jgi:hypothetical protein
LNEWNQSKILHLNYLNYPLVFEVGPRYSHALSNAPAGGFRAAGKSIVRNASRGGWLQAGLPG